LPMLSTRMREDRKTETMAIPTVTTSDVDSLLSKTEKPLLVYLWSPGNT
jgi:hypothetical protein